MKMFKIDIANFARCMKNRMLRLSNESFSLYEREQGIANVLTYTSECRQERERQEMLLTTRTAQNIR